MSPIFAQRKNIVKFGFILLMPLFVLFSQVLQAEGKTVVEKKSNFGTIKGVIRDEFGKPIANAIVAVFLPGTSEIFQLSRANSNGSYLARLIPGTYMIIAAARGFNAVTIPEVQVSRLTELNYGFKLLRVGNGETLPEKTTDRNSSKWRIRNAQSRRSIYQNGEGEIPVEENEIAVADLFTDEADEKINRRAQSVVETYFAGSEEGNFVGFNFATLQPLGENSEIIIAGQTGTKSFAPNRIEAALQARPNENHKIRLSASLAKLGKIKVAEIEKQLGQFSLQAFDEWKVRDGVILVLGIDYSRFLGAGDDFSIAPRFGLQTDINSKTRFKTAYTTQTEDKTWSEAIEFEGSQVLFRQQFEPKSIALEEEKPLMNKSRRFEFGIERILGSGSSIEATAFFDSVSGRGIGFTSLPGNALNSEGLSQINGIQQGRAEGIRIVYSRRLNGMFSTAAGYAFGSGQKLSPHAVTTPNQLLENGFFQTFVGQLNTNLKTGTNVQTIFRLSPEATVFAIDPFQGRVAIFDPSLSILVTQPLPNLGLPIRATAVLDARNLLDFQTGINGEEGSLLFNSHRRILRGGISVRF